MTLLDSLLTLAWTLSEVLSDATAYFSTACFPQVLMTLIVDLPDVGLPRNIKITALQTLNTLTDENMDILSAMGPHVSSLVSMVVAPPFTPANTPTTTDEKREDLHQAHESEMKILATSILYNLRLSMDTATTPASANLAAPSLAKLLELSAPALTTILSRDINPLIRTCVELHRQDQSKQEVPMTDEEMSRVESGVESDLDQKLQVLEAHINLINLALEILSNLCSDDVPMDEDWEDCEARILADEDDEEEDGDEDMVLADDEVMTAVAVEENIDPRLLFLASQTTIISHLLSLIAVPQSHVESVDALISILLLRTLSSLTNVLLFIPASKTSLTLSSDDYIVPPTLWSTLFNLAHTHASSNPELFSQILSSLYAMSRLNLPYTITQANILKLSLPKTIPRRADFCARWILAV